MRTFSFSISVAIVVGAIIGSTFFAHAQTPPPPRPQLFEDRQASRTAAFEDRQELRQEAFENRLASSTLREERLEAKQASSTARKEMVEERRAALSEQAQKRIINLSANISNRVDAAILRFTNIINRFNSRIDKLDERGVDTSVAKTHIDAASTALNSAKTRMANIDALVNTSVTSETPREQWQAVKQSMIATKTDLQTVKSELQTALAALKEAVAAAELERGVSQAVTDITNEDDAANEDDADESSEAASESTDDNESVN